MCLTSLVQAAPGDWGVWPGCITFPDWEKNSHSLSEILAYLDIMGDQLTVPPLISRYSSVLMYGGFQGILNFASMMPRDASLSDRYTSDQGFLFLVWSQPRRHSIYWCARCDVFFLDTRQVGKPWNVEDCRKASWRNSHLNI